MSRATLRRHLPAVGIGGLLLFTSLWLQPSFAELHSPNPLVRIYLTRAVVDDGTLSIDGPIQRFGNLSDKSRRDGHYYCDKAPGVSLLAVPIYSVLRLFAPAERIDNALLLGVSRALLASLPAALTVALIHFWLLGLGVGSRARLASLAALAGGSLLLPYSLELFGHGLAAFFVALCGYLALAPRRPAQQRPGLPALRLVGAGLAAGLAVLTEYPTLFLVGSLLIATLLASPRRLRDLGLVALGGAGPAIVFMVYNQLAFGGPLTTGYAFIDSAYFRSIHAQGFMGLSWPQPEAFWASFFSPTRGLLFAAPWFAAAPIGALLLWRRQRHAAVALLACALIYTLFVSSFRYWIGGWAIGQRHLTPLLPLAALAVGVAADRLQRGWTRWHALGRVLLAASMAVGVLQIGAAALTMPTFAEEFANPFYELTLRLWRAGMFPHSLGSRIGLGDAVGIAPAVVAVGLLLLICMRMAAPRHLPAAVDASRRLGAALGVGLWLSVAPLAGQGDARSQHRFEWIVDTVWEPRSDLPARLPDPVKTLPGLQRGGLRSPAMLRHLARHRAAEGDSAGAVELLGQARLQELEEK